MINERRNNPASGFTLVEIMVAICFLAIASLAICSQTIKAETTISHSQSFTEATHLATTYIERFKLLSMGHDDLKENHDADPYFIVDGGYLVEINITDNVPLPEARTADGNVQTVTKLIELYIYDDPGLQNVDQEKRQKLRLTRLNYIKKFEL